MMCKLVNQQSAPEIDIDVFGGNPLEFHYFMAVFDEAVEKKIEDPCWQKLHTTSSKGRI